MVRIAHIADTHLGYKQYNLEEREQDIYDALMEIAHKILEERVDVVVHSGDLFDSARPPTRAYYEFKKFLNTLNGRVKVFTILGDHDAPKRRGMPPHMLFDDQIEILGLNADEHRILNIAGEEILIAGISNLSRRYREVLVEELKKLDALAAKHKTSVLMLHQAIDKFFTHEEVFELRLEEVPKNFKYYAMGHLHIRARASHGNGELGYAGSTEIMRKDEITGWEKRGKGFYLVDIIDGKVSVAEVKLESIRPQIRAKLSYANFQKELQALVNSIGESAKLPVIHVVVEGREIDRQSVHQALNEALTKKALLIRQEFIEETERELRELKPGSFNINEMLREYLQDIEIAELGFELFKFLKHGDIEEAKKIADEYFKKVGDQ
jgi:DNA repair exonuclease SbcCD nuclease subunit